METAGASLSWHMRWTCEASKSNVSPGGCGSLRGGPPSVDPLLGHLALHDRDRAARDVVVVEARVVAVRPRDHPHVDVIVAPQLLEVALGRAVAHEPAPLLRLGGDARSTSSRSS